MKIRMIEPDGHVRCQECHDLAPEHITAANYQCDRCTQHGRN